MDKKDENLKIGKSTKKVDENYYKHKVLILKYRRTVFKNKITKLLLNKLLKK